MNKKSVLVLVACLFIFFMIVSVLVSAEDRIDEDSDEDERIDAAYECLQDSVGEDCKDLSQFEELAFSVLALGTSEGCDDKLLDLSKNEECWPKTGCKVKETAIAMLALENAGKNTDEIQAWLQNKTRPASNLEWFLQIESPEATTCSISYGSSYTINIGADKKINTNAGACLSLAQGNYWLKINSDCLNKEYTISCNKEFETTLLYKKPDSSTIYVSQEVNAEVAGGETAEKVKYRCFGGTTCDYEGSLWAALAIYENEDDIDEYLPYLEAFAEDNEKYFPEAFLYKITASESFFNSLLNDNFKTNFWTTTVYTKFYNTALALLALQGQDPSQALAAKDYFLSADVQDKDGCWKNANVRDTAFLLSVAWPESSGGGTGSECSNDTDCRATEECINDVCVTSSNENCESKQGFCLSSISQCESIGGVGLTWDCPNLFQTCCSKNLQSCAGQEGEICDTGEECPFGSSIESSDSGTCCEEVCVIKAEPEETECKIAGYNCKSVCLDDEEEKPDLDCGGVRVCCSASTSEPTSYWWVWILLILIIILIIAIIFRNKLRLLLFRMKSNFRKGPSPTQTRPSFPPSPGPNIMRSLPIRPMVRPASRTMPRIGRDSEFEATLKKLKEMSK